MKRIAAWFLVFLMLFTLAACGTDEKASDDSATPESGDTDVSADVQTDVGEGENGSAEKSAEGMVFAGSCYSFNDTFINSIVGHLETFTGEYGATVEFNDAQSSQPTQTDAINGYITKGVNGLMINIIDTTATSLILQAAEAESLPVVFFEHQPEDADLRSYDKCWSVGSNNPQGGTYMAELLLDYWDTYENADRNGDGVYQYILIEGQVGENTSQTRSQYIKDVLESSGKNVEMIGNSVGEWSRATAYDQMSGFISSIGLENIDGILAVNDDMALGCVEALKVNGFNTDGVGTENYIPVVGIDGTDAGFESLSNGELWATVLNDAKTYAKCCTEILVAAANGLEVNEENVGFPVIDEKYFQIDHIKVTQENWEEIQAEYKS